MSKTATLETSKTKKLPSTNPRVSASVSASAGTGKTWLLVTRLIRLLLSGTRPDGILAVTFTRKAAAEMQTRLNARLLDMAQCSEQELINQLSEMGAATDEESLQHARTLYETLLSNPHTVRTTTFHSFCQDILRRFPLEADIAPGFELLETTADERKIAWNALSTDASNKPNSDISQAMEILLESCGGLANTITALNSFLDHRSDWWAFTEKEPEQQADIQGKENNDPLLFAIETLSSQLNVSLSDKPEAEFFSLSILDSLKEFVSLLQKHPGKKNDQALEMLSIAQESSNDGFDRFQAIKKSFLTQKGEPQKRKESKAQAKSMGEAGQQRFLEIHDLVCSVIEGTRKIIFAQEALRRNIAWYNAGNQLLKHFQLLKAEQRLLDFSDLEWRAYLLLNQGDNVHWIQYKLDQRIDHLLVDEFQDTNPTQWRLILPLLQELAAGEDERGRSVFLVGDNKQSIYRFRRADPELFDTAQSWLKSNLHAVSQPLDVSWRSADAIMKFVNQVFGNGPLHEQLTQFSIHTTHHPDLWGRVELLPLIEQVSEQDLEQNPEQDSDPDDDAVDTLFDLRNPLQSPRIIELDQRHLEEGRLIAERIREMIKDETLIGAAGSARPIDYNDIIILVRNRTHAADYEQALRELKIPYIGANRGALLESQEARDLVYLLELLIAPFNNLALASLLRSPLFNCSHEDLIRLAQEKDGSWMQRLSVLASKENSIEPSNSALTRAYTLLVKWQELAGKMPVHDLLDHIYSDGDVMNRYHAAYPPHLQHRVAANLTRFIELALEVDSGRYPTIGRFVARLKLLRQQEHDAPDEGTPMQSDSQVRIMTIHASKGLEAPVIFLADATTSGQNKNAYQAIVDWPTQSERPESILLTGKKENLDDFTKSVLDRNARAETCENANLLYVAVTRAKQLLFISGCRPKKANDLGWYGLITDQYHETSLDNSVIVESGNYPETSVIVSKVDAPPTNIDPLLSKPLPTREREIIIAPSYHERPLKQLSPDNQKQESILFPNESRTRGIFIHRCLQILCGDDNRESGDETLLKRISNELGISYQGKEAVTAFTRELNQWLKEAQAVFSHPEFSHFFEADQYLSAYNEAPVQYVQTKEKTEQMVYGIIDRVVIKENEVFIIDYKTHRLTTPEQTATLVETYRPQINLYCQGAKQLWPDKTVRGFLLLTHKLQLVPIQT